MEESTVAATVTSESISKTSISGVTYGLKYDLSYSENKTIDVSVNTSLVKTHDARNLLAEQVSLLLKAEDCSWNVYATKKALSTFHTQSRPQIFDSSPDAKTVRTGNKIFFLDKKGNDTMCESFVPTKFSLSLDEVERVGRYLVVTSRQKVEDVPEIEREKPKEDEKSEDTEKKASDSSETKPGEERKDDEKPETKANAKENDNKEAESDSEPEPEDYPYGVSASEDDLSAYESWSEGSTDLEDIGIKPIQDLRPEVPLSNPEEIKRAKNNKNGKAASDSDESSDEESDSDESCGCCHSDSDASIEDGDNQRFQSAAANDQEENYRMYDEIYQNDRVDPYSDDESNEDEEVWQDSFAESGWALFGDDEDFDHNFKQFDDDDSDDCSDCGGDDGACVKLPADDKSKVGKDVEELENSTEPPLGTPMAQINVYDTSILVTDDNDKPTFKRLFRFQRMVMEPLHNSPPAVHKKKSLLVWPIGDSKILVADYKHNTYFMKRLRLSRIFSTHVSVNCRISADGQFLHVAALERQGKPPLRPKQLKEKKRLEKKEGKKAEIKEVPVYDVVTSTYRLSQGKTARAPPVLIHQVKRSLGPIEEKHTLPTYTWLDNSVFLTHACAEKQIRMLEIPLFRGDAGTSMTEPVIVDVEGELIGKHVHLRDNVKALSVKDLSSRDLELIDVAQIRPFYKPEEAEKDKKDESSKEVKESEVPSADAKEVEAAPNVSKATLETTS